MAKAHAHHKNISEVIKRGKNQSTMQAGKVDPHAKCNTDTAHAIARVPPVIFLWTTNDEKTSEECCSLYCASESLSQCQVWMTTDFTQWLNRS